LLYKGKYFEVRYDIEAPIPGLIVIASIRHIIGLADLTKSEQKEFIEITCKVRKILRDKANIEYIRILHKETTIISKVNPSHFHIAILPLDDWMENKSAKEILVHSMKNFKTKEKIDEVKRIAKIVKKEFN